MDGRAIVQQRSGDMASIGGVIRGEAEGECILVPQKVLFSDGDALRFVIYASEGTMDEELWMQVGKRKGAN